LGWGSLPTKGFTRLIIEQVNLDGIPIIDIKRKRFMPIPKKAKNEPPKKFMSRCMGDDVMKKEYPDKGQRAAICTSKATESISLVDAVDLQLKSDADKKAGYPPNCNEGYAEKDGKCVPVEDGERASFKYEDPKTREVYLYQRRGIYKKNGRILVYRGENK